MDESIRNYVDMLVREKFQKFAKSKEETLNAISDITEIKQTVREVIRLEVGSINQQFLDLKEFVSGDEYHNQLQEKLQESRFVLSEMKKIIAQKTEIVINRELNNLNIRQEIQEEVGRRLSQNDKLVEIVNIIGAQAFKQFKKVLNKKMTNLIAVKTSTIGEIRDIVNELPVEMGDDEEFWNQMKDGGQFIEDKSEEKLLE